MRFKQTSDEVLEFQLDHPASLYKRMENVLQKLSRQFVAMDDRRAPLVATVQKVLNHLIQELRCTQPVLFGDIFSEVFPVGSYYDGVRVKKATEFDFNIVLNLPFDFVIDTNNEPGGYAKLRVNETDNALTKLSPLLQKIIKSWFNDRKYLSSSRIRAHLEKITHDWARSLDLSEFGVSKVRIHKSGPALTLDLTLDSDEVSVDLVPVLRVTKPPPKAFRWGGESRVMSGPWFLVPKSYSYGSGREDESWRPSFPLQERNMLAVGRTKHVLRLLKRVRDCLKMHGVSSYYIKTLFLWKLMDKTLDWTSNSLSYLFFTMLKVLQQCLAKHKIPNFWCKANVIQHLHRDTTWNWSNRLNKHLQRLQNSLEAKDDRTMETILTELFQDPDISPDRNSST